MPDDTFSCNTRYIEIFREKCVIVVQRRDEQRGDREEVRRGRNESMTRPPCLISGSTGVWWLRKVIQRLICLSEFFTCTCTISIIGTGRPAFSNKSILNLIERERALCNRWFPKTSNGSPAIYNRRNRRFFARLEVDTDSQTGHSYRHVGKNGVEMSAGRWENEGAGHREPCRLAGLVLHWWVERSINEKDSWAN